MIIHIIIPNQKFSDIACDVLQVDTNFQSSRRGREGLIKNYHRVNQYYFLWLIKLKFIFKFPHFLTL